MKSIAAFCLLALAAGCSPQPAARGYADRGSERAGAASRIGAGGHSADHHQRERPA